MLNSERILHSHYSSQKKVDTLAYLVKFENVVSVVPSEALTHLE